MKRTLAIALVLVAAIVAMLTVTYRDSHRNDAMVSASVVAFAAAEEPLATEAEHALIEPVADGEQVALAGRSAGDVATDGAAIEQDWVRIPGTPIGIWPKP